MNHFYEVYIIHSDSRRELLGKIATRDVMYNRYNEGLLIGAGKLHGSNLQKETFLYHEAKYRNKAHIEFVSNTVVFSGIFCFFSFIPETHTVVFGSVSAVTRHDQTETIIPARRAQPVVVAAE